MQKALHLEDLCVQWRDELRLGRQLADCRYQRLDGAARVAQQHAVLLQLPAEAHDCKHMPIAGEECPRSSRLGS